MIARPKVRGGTMSGERHRLLFASKAILGLKQTPGWSWMFLVIPSPVITSNWGTCKDLVELQDRSARVRFMSLLYLTYFCSSASSGILTGSSSNVKAVKPGFDHVPARGVSCTKAIRKPTVCVMFQTCRTTPARSLLPSGDQGKAIDCSTRRAVA